MSETKEKEGRVGRGRVGGGGAGGAGGGETERIVQIQNSVEQGTELQNIIRQVICSSFWFFFLVLTERDLKTSSFNFIFPLDLWSGMSDYFLCAFFTNVTCTFTLAE